MVRVPGTGIKLAAGVAVVALQLADPARSEVWEFDRDGKMLTGSTVPERPPDNSNYVKQRSTWDFLD